MAEQKTGKTIGQINGPWAIMLRVALATYPLIVAWCVWMTVEQFRDKGFRESGPRFTALDNDLADAQLRSEVMSTIAALPPPDWRDRILAIEKLATINSEKLTRVLTILEEREP